MSFKDKKPNTIPEGYYYTASEMDEYLAIVEPMAENWEKYEGLGFLPVELFTRLIRFFDELRGYAAENTQMQIKAEGFYNKLIVIENPLKMYEKLEAVKSWVEYELIEYDNRRLHFAAYKLERDRHDRLIQLDKILGAS